MIKVNSTIIEKINILGPWVHGYFKLPNGTIIQDTDSYQRARIFHLRDLFVDIIRSHFGLEKLREKSILDIGCNAGYFLFELYNFFEFNLAKGLDPKKSNIAKAKFIASQFKLPKEKYSLAIGNLFKVKKNVYDVVIMPGVMHHLDDHMLACKRLFEITGELLIVETMALPDEVESQSMASFLELKDDVYKNHKAIFGVTGHKFESEYLDGATASSGVVSIPSKNSLYMSLFNAGFRDIKLFNVLVPFNFSDEKLLPKYRDMRSVMAVAIKPRPEEMAHNFFEDNTRLSQQNEIEIVVPINVIEPLYQMVKGGVDVVDLTGEATLTFNCLLKNKDPENEIFKKRPYYSILKSLMHSPLDKIRVEYAKSLIQSGEVSKAGSILNTVIQTINCDWRSVYRAYYLLAMIAFNEGKISDAYKNNSKALKAHSNFFPAIRLHQKLINVANNKLEISTKK